MRIHSTLPFAVAAGLIAFAIPARAETCTDHYQTCLRKLIDAKLASQCLQAKRTCEQKCINGASTFIGPESGKLYAVNSCTK